MQRLKVLLLFGGESSEHEVSINSAHNVYAALDDQKYDVSLCYIDTQGQWWLVDDIEATNKTQVLLPELGKKRLIFGSNKLFPDVLLPILHGTNGEDGSVQGLAQLLHIPIAGCDVLGSAICIDKDVTKRLLKQAGILVVDSVTCRKGDILDFSRLTLQLGNPLFIKPVRQGSSVGVSRVTTRDEFEVALRAAFQLDSKVLVEQAIKGRELECAVLGNTKPQASVVGEILPDETFYSYESKYSATSQTQTVTPADIPQAVAEQVQALAVQAYQATECRGMARVDFFLDESDQLYINEINTLPGFTNISMYPKLWRASGLHYSALLDRLIDLALEK